MTIKDKKDMVLPNLYDFFKQDDNIQKMLPIIMGESKISIRVLDWFVTNYSKNKKLYYKIDDKTFNVHMDYKSQLKGYKKKLFDPFCREKRIPFYYSDDQYVITTIGQLNFFKWAISKKILDYVNDNFNSIYKDMQKKKELIDSETLTTNDPKLLSVKTSEDNIIQSKTIYLNEKIEISFDLI
jgi:hypothetical protein